MTDYKHGSFETPRGFEPTLRERFTSDDLIEYKITGESTLRWPTLPLFAVAEEVFGDSSFWWILMDVNPLKNPAEWQPGDTILIPKNYRDAVQFVVPNAFDRPDR